MSGIIELEEIGMWPWHALVPLFASILVPVLKLAGLTGFLDHWATIRFGSPLLSGTNLFFRPDRSDRAIVDLGRPS